MTDLRVKPPLGLHAELIDVTGKTWRWDANARDPQDRPQNLSFRTQRGDGFAEGSVTLRRRIDREYPDLALLTKLRFVAQDGFIAYEGRISEFPRELGSDGHSIQVTAAGYMASARDRKFSEPYVDRDLSRWTGMSRARRVSILSGATTMAFDGGVEWDTTGEVPCLKLQYDGIWTSTTLPRCEMWYDAGPEAVADSMYYDYVIPSGAQPGATNGRLIPGAYDDDAGASGETGSDLYGATTGSGTYSPATPRRYLNWTWDFTAAAGSDGATWIAQIRLVAVFGNHGLEPRGTAPAHGFYASDLIRNICARFCPQLDPSGVEDTSYVLQQAAFHDPIEPYEAFQELNRYHLWELSCWESGKLCFHEPTPLDDWDWEVRTDDPGVEVRLQGDSIEDLANGVVVTYDDFAGIERRITPDDNDQLSDTSEDNPANIWGIDRWTEPPGGKIAFPTTEDDAVQIGRAALGEFSQPKSPGEITIRGHIRDRRGNWVPTHRVRCGERIRIANHPNDRPRRIVDTDFTDDEMKTLRISTDNATKRVEGLFDRIETARKAAGLT